MNKRSILASILSIETSKGALKKAKKSFSKEGRFRVQNAKFCINPICISKSTLEES